MQRSASAPRTTPPTWTAPAVSGRFRRGLTPSPRHVLLAAVPHLVVMAPPAQFAVVPGQLSMWGNDTYGDCVTAEEAFAKACHSPEIFIPDATVEAWAQAHGYLNGADLTPVMDSMARAGFAQGSQTYDDGPYSAVDYSTETVLQSAIALGPVKLGIDANALPSTAGNQQGWYATGGNPGQFSSEDHCVSLSGYGTAQYLYGQLGVPLPSALQPAQSGYLLFTWSTLGFVDHAWLVSCCGEAWVRNPTTVGVPPLPGPTPTPTPTPAPAPVPVGPTAAQVVKAAVAAIEATCRQHPFYAPEIRFSEGPVTAAINAQWPTAHDTLLARCRDLGARAGLSIDWVTLIQQGVPIAEDVLRLVEQVLAAQSAPSSAPTK